MVWLTWCVQESKNSNKKKKKKLLHCQQTHGLCPLPLSAGGRAVWSVWLGSARLGLALCSDLSFSQFKALHRLSDLLAGDQSHTHLLVTRSPPRCAQLQRTFHPLHPTHTHTHHAHQPPRDTSRDFSLNQMSTLNTFNTTSPHLPKPWTHFTWRHNSQNSILLFS